MSLYKVLFGVGWGGSCRVGHAGMGQAMQGWGGSCRDGVQWVIQVRGGVGLVGWVGWVMQGWGGWVMRGRVVRGGVGWVMQWWGGVGHTGVAWVM